MTDRGRLWVQVSTKPSMTRRKTPYNVKNRRR